MMSHLSQKWEQRYKENNNVPMWPWSDLVSYIMRHTSVPNTRNLSDICVLEIGCGAGANIPFFEKLDMNYYAIEGSHKAVKILHETYPKLKNQIVQGDFTAAIPFEREFDLIVDRCAMTNCSTAGIQKCLDHLYSCLKKGGKYIGIDWFSTEDDDYRKGEPTEDIYTRTNYTDGRFADVGDVHFSDQSHLLECFHMFKVEVMEHKVIKQEIPSGGRVKAYWNMVFTKES